MEPPFRSGINRRNRTGRVNRGTSPAAAARLFKFRDGVKSSIVVKKMRRRFLLAGKTGYCAKQLTCFGPRRIGLGQIFQQPPRGVGFGACQLLRHRQDRAIG